MFRSIRMYILLKNLVVLNFSYFSVTRTCANSAVYGMVRSHCFLISVLCFLEYPYCRAHGSAVRGGGQSLHSGLRFMVLARPRPTNASHPPEPLNQTSLGGTLRAAIQLHNL